MGLFKKVFSIAVAAAALVGCSANGGGRLKDWMGDGSGKPRVLSTTAQIGDLVNEIGGERVKNWVLIQGISTPTAMSWSKGMMKNF